MERFLLSCLCLSLIYFWTNEQIFMELWITFMTIATTEALYFQIS